MRERGMIFNADMVRAVLNGSKTQTRRIMKVQPSECFNPLNMALETDFKAHWYTPGVVDKDGYLQPAKKQAFGVASEDEGYTCPFGAVGDRLWVRETFRLFDSSVECACEDHCSCSCYHGKPMYRANGNDSEAKWIPSIHMPRWASRITLEITGVRVERLQDISEEDAKAEGIIPAAGGVEKGWEHRFNLRELWIGIYGEESWQANPWVWVIEFKRVEHVGEEGV